MTVPQRITGFLRANPRKLFCDDCIANRLKLAHRQQAQQATVGLATVDFPRHMGTCFDCGGIKQVIQSKLGIRGSPPLGSGPAE
jgi:hypothetical protein